MNTTNRFPFLLRGATLTVAAVVAAGLLTACQPTAQAPAEPAGPQLPRLADKPDFNGIWQAIGTAHWNLEDHSASGLADFWQLGAIAAIPAGQSVVEGGTIPYLPAALAKRDENRAGWPKTDPEAKCYMPGIPRATYMPFPFRIVQGDGDILFVYEFASANRIVHMSNHEEPPVDSWMGWSNGRWEGDTLVIEVTGNNDQTWFDRSGNHHGAMLKVTERYTLMDPNHIQYEATIEDPETFSQPWKISLPLYRRLDNNVQLLEFKCVEFSEELLYGDLVKKTE
jgi:hypothetical protein